MPSSKPPFFNRRAIIAAGLAASTLRGVVAPARAAEAEEIAALKTEIRTLARRFVGQGDPDFTRQRALEPLVDALRAAAPQPPISERLGELAGAWKQVWGPYDYRSADSRGVDPDSVPAHIYQVVFPAGYYYNVTPRSPEETRPARDIILLRGVYAVAGDDPDMLRVRFTDFPTGEIASNALDSMWRLAARAEDGTLPNRGRVLPSFLVRAFFGGGGLREVYTDADMRLTYGATSLTDRSREALYVFDRVG